MAVSPATPPLSAADHRHNYRCGLINGIFFTIGETISSPGLVLSLLIRQLGGSLTLVGLMPVIQNVGYLLPQLLVVGRVQAMRKRLPLYRNIGIMRLFAQVGLIAAILSALVLPPPISLALIIVCYILFNFTGGITTIAFQDVAAKVIPLPVRGRFFGTRQLVGGLLAFALGGTLVRWVLGDTSPLEFPLNFATLAFVSLLCFIVGIGSFSLIREPPQTEVGPQVSIGAVLRRAPQILRANRNYRWFIVARLLLRAGQIAEPFYIIYATERLGLSPGVAGIFVAIWALAAALSNLIWARVTDRQGPQRVMIIAGALIAFAPLLILVAPLLTTGMGAALLIAALGLAFLSVGAGNDGVMIVAMTYVLEVAPEDERPIYLGVANTLLGVGALLPLLGGWLIGVIGFQSTFAIGTVLGCLGVAAATRLGRGRP